MRSRSSITRNVALSFGLMIAVLAGLTALGISQLRLIQVHHRRAEHESGELALAKDVLAAIRGAAVENSFYVSTGDTSRVRVRDSLMQESRMGIAALAAGADRPVERDAWQEAARQLEAWRPLIAGVATAATAGRPVEVTRRIREQALPKRLRLEAAVRTGIGMEQAALVDALAGSTAAGRMAYVLFLGGGLIALLAAAATGVTFARHIRDQMKERAHASQALRESEERYRRLFDNMSEGCAWCRLVRDGGTVVDYEYVAVNRAFEHITGLTNVAGRRASEVIPGIHGTNPELLQQFALVSHTGEPIHSQGLVPQLGRWLSRSIYRVDDQQFVSVFADITDERRGRLALEQSEARFREIADHITQVYFTVEPSGKALYVSPAYEAVWGRSVAAATAAPWAWMDGVHPDDLRAVRAAMRRGALETNGAVNEFRVQRPNGSERWVRSRAWGVRDASDTLVRIVGYAEDITDLHEAERRLIHAQKMEAVGRLAGGVAHDFNNVLTVIQGYAEMARDDLSREELRSDLAEITGAVGKAQALTRQLLAFSRQQVLQPIVLDADRAIAGTEKMLRRLIGEDVDLVFELKADKTRIRVDGGQLEQVLLNLAVNARDAMPRGGQLSITTSRVRLDAANAAVHELPGPGEYLVIAVSDTGTGMTPDVRDRVFEPFFTTKDPGKGTGLGLSTVFGIVKQSGGHITVYSEFGRGTTFRLYLPAVDAAAQASEEVERTVAAAGRQSGVILLAEDDSAVRGVAAGVLGRQGYTALLAANGVEALAQAQAHKDQIDLVITDVVMPVMDGPTLVTELKRRFPGIRALFTSGYTGDDIVRRGVIESGVPFLEKPYTPAILLQRVRDALETSPATP